MSILAIEKEITTANWNTADKEILAQEAHDVYNMYLTGQLREHYFNDEKCCTCIGVR